MRSLIIKNELDRRKTIIIRIPIWIENAVGLASRTALVAWVFCLRCVVQGIRT
jgi:hypothetical protein